MSFKSLIPLIPFDDFDHFDDFDAFLLIPLMPLMSLMPLMPLKTLIPSMPLKSDDQPDSKICLDHTNSNTDKSYPTSPVTLILVLRGVQGRMVRGAVFSHFWTLRTMVNMTKTWF